MPITFTDEQLAQLRSQLADAQRNKEVADFATSIWNDPALSDDAKALAKRKYPDAQIPDWDLKQHVDKRFAEEKQEREKREKEATEKAASESFAEQRKSVQERYGFTDDAMERMEKEMNDRRVYDYDVMAEHFAAKQPKPIEQTGGHFWNHAKQDTFRQIAADPEDYAFNELSNALQNEDQRRRSAR